MPTLQAEDFLHVRDAAAGRGPVDQALALLMRAFPGGAAETLPLGVRNAQLLALHAQLFGTALEAYAECPHCGEELELALDTGEFPPPGEDVDWLLETEGYSIRFRSLDSTDLRAAASCTSVDEARAMLIERCVVEAPVAAAELPPEVIEQLAARLEECDPLAETLLDLRCPACKGEWQIAFDIASFLFGEVDLQARRLLREVHALARGYGWREADILAMSARRRRDYLELLLS